MRYSILQRAADTPEGLILLGPIEIAVFEELVKRDLIKGAVHRPVGKPAYAVVHCLTPDGRALLAFREFSARRFAPAPAGLA